MVEPPWHKGPSFMNLILPPRIGWPSGLTTSRVSHVQTLDKASYVLLFNKSIKLQDAGSAEIIVQLGTASGDLMSDVPLLQNRLICCNGFSPACLFEKCTNDFYRARIVSKSSYPGVRHLGRHSLGAFFPHSCVHRQGKSGPRTALPTVYIQSKKPFSNNYLYI